jgi:molybdenum cofactor cytidylyltransferase
MSVAAVVVAAGGSRRMGRPKQLLPFGGRSLLRRAAEAALGAGCDPVVVVLGASAELLREETAGWAVTVIDNPDWEQGPGTSVRAGMTKVEYAEAVLFLVCDQPFVDAEHLDRLINAWRESGLPMAASSYAETVGVPALFASSCFDDLRGLPPQAGAKKLLVSQPDRVAAVLFPAGAIDLDTPEDVANLRAGLPTS